MLGPEHEKIKKNLEFPKKEVLNFPRGLILSKKLWNQIFGQKIQVSIEKSLAQIGSGSLPVANLPSLAIVLKSDQLAADSIAERFRNQPRSVIGRVKDGCFWIDLRTVNDREIEWICEAARSIN